MPLKFLMERLCVFNMQVSTVFPGYVWGIGARTPPGIPKSVDAQVLYIKWNSTCI